MNNMHMIINKDKIIKISYAYVEDKRDYKHNVVIELVNSYEIFYFLSKIESNHFINAIICCNNSFVDLSEFKCEYSNIRKTISTNS